MDNLKVWEGVKHGVDTDNWFFQAWFVGVPVAYLFLRYLFRQLDWWGFETRKGGRTSDIMAFEFVALVSVCYLGGAGLALTFGKLGTAADLALVTADPFYANSKFVEEHLIYPMITFQGWNVVLCLLEKDLNNTAMIGHHLATLSLGYFGLHPYLHGQSLFFFGTAELTNIPLTIYDMFKYMKPAGWQKEYKGIFEFAKISFALSFVVLRICYWPYMSYPFWVSSLELLQSGKAHSNFVVGFFLGANVFLTGLQFLWGKSIVESALGLGASTGDDYKDNKKSSSKKGGKKD